MHQRREYADNEQITIGFKAYGKLASAVHRAAESAGADSTSQWLLRLAAAAAAESLGVTVESLDILGPRKIAAAKAQAPAAADATTIARLESTIADALTALQALKASRVTRRRG